ncbi:small ubiquitin-related modifier sumo2 [Acrasis kona]|uniref:Small ubiquitin-related modifier sumo2 n=1 Tax=Acrasis kona TaxID=1008807 RepID=A0AAW2YM55_9EUKA
MEELPTSSSQAKQEPGSAEGGAQSEHVNLKVSFQGADVHFKIKRKTPLGKLMSAFVKRQNVGLGTMRFLFDGKRISEHDTADSLGLEEDDIIDVMIEQTGGSKNLISY